MRWIYISPHLDDAVLSAGGLIYNQTRAGMDVEIWTLLSGFPPGEISPFAQSLHAQWGIPDPSDLIRARRAEDLAAAEIVGAKAIHFDFLDCIYRRGKNGEWLYAEIFVPPHEDEADLVAQIADSISARLTPEDQLVCPLGIGAHVDHTLARRAVEALPRPVLYYADIPYLFRHPLEFAQKTDGMTRDIHQIEEIDLRVWLDAMEKYASQLGSLFESPSVMRAQIREYWLAYKGISLWSNFSARAVFGISHL